MGRIFYHEVTKRTKSCLAWRRGVCGGLFNTESTEIGRRDLRRHVVVLVVDVLRPVIVSPIDAPFERVAFVKR